MNKIYDKLLLVIAVLLLAGGVFLYIQKSGAAPSAGQPVDTTPADNPYQPEPVPTSDASDASWPEPTEDSNGWLYDIFTPPKIYIDENGQFSAEGYRPPPPPVPFGVYLAEVMRKPYRIQLEGYIEEDLSDASKFLLLLFDEEKQKQVRARPGDEKPDSEFTLVSFEIERIRDADNNIEKVATAVILDQRSGEEITLLHGERLFDEGVTVVIRSDDDASYEQVFTEAPASFDGPSGRFIFQEINLEDSSVTVEKQGDGENEAETKVLSARQSISSIPPESKPQEEAAPAEETFDFMF